MSMRRVLLASLLVLSGAGCSSPQKCDVDCAPTASAGAVSVSAGTPGPSLGASSAAPTSSVGSGAATSSTAGASISVASTAPLPSLSTGAPDPAPSGDAGAPVTTASVGMVSADAAASSAGPGDAEPPSARLKAIPVGTTDAELGYWEYLPPGYGDTPVPLLVFTHGASWMGDGSEAALQQLLEVGPPNLISTDAWPNERPFVMLAPQNPRSGCFDPGDIDAFFLYALEHYNIDPARIYLTGQSCGAIGAWGYLAEHLDELVTAAVLIAGDGRDAFAQAGCDLGRIAIWGLHNEDDPSVSSVGTIEPLNELAACSPAPDVKLTIYPDSPVHDAWTKTYDLSAGNDVFSWLLEHEHP
jgi:hypothetical protein